MRDPPPALMVLITHADTRRACLPCHMGCRQVVVHICGEYSGTVRGHRSACDGFAVLRMPDLGLEVDTSWSSPACADTTTSAPPTTRADQACAWTEPSMCTEPATVPPSTKRSPRRAHTARFSHSADTEWTTERMVGSSRLREMGGSLEDLSCPAYARIPGCYARGMRGACALGWYMIRNKL